MQTLLDKFLIYAALELAEAKGERLDSERRATQQGLDDFLREWLGQTEEPAVQINDVVFIVGPDSLNVYRVKPFNVVCLNTAKHQISKATGVDVRDITDDEARDFLIPELGLTRKERIAS